MKDLIVTHKNREILKQDMGKAWEIWDAELKRLADNTQKGYLLGVGRFLEYLDTGYEGLYEMKLADMRSNDPRDMRRVERKLSQFMFKLIKDEGLSWSTATRVGTAVTHFMRTQGLTFNLMKNEWPKGEYLGQRIVLAHQIKQMHENASAWMRERNRALMMIAKDTGLRISDIEQLNVSDYQDARLVLAGGESFKELRPLSTVKTKAITYPCIGPETIEALDLYLKDRDAKRGDPLFIDHDGNRMKVTAMSEQFRRFSDYLEDGSRISAHSFRKFHETMMESAGIPLNWIKRYQGRKVSDSTGPYSNPQDIPDRLINRYIEAYDSLRVFTDKKEIKIQQDKIKNLETQVEALKQLIEEKLSKDS